MTKKEKELLNKGLPKWAKMYITGIPIKEEQALEIIRRTDTYFNHPTDNIIATNLSVPNLMEEKSYESYYRKYQKWKKIWNYIELEHINNSWINSSYFYGAHGWCHPDGMIGYSENIGKYPDIKEVYKDLKKIVKEFPFLELGVTLYNGETCEENISPVISFKIKDETIEIIDPREEDVHKEHIFESSQDYLKKINPSSFIGTTHYPKNAITSDVIENWKKYL